MMLSLLLSSGDRVIRVKSWKPAWGKHGLEWPTMLVDLHRYRRMTLAPVWDRALLKHIWDRLRPASPEEPKDG